MNASQLIDKAIAETPDWRGETMAEVRRIIRATIPDVVEEWKWMGTPTWSHNGIICICDAFKNVVKVGFLWGAKIDDPDRLFNDELGGNQRRAIKYFEGDKVKERGLKKLLLNAVAFNATKGKSKAKPVAPKGTKAKPRAKIAAKKSPRAAPKAKRPAAPRAKAEK